MTSACSGGELSAGAGAGAGGIKKDETSGKAQESDDDESAKADTPTQVSGAFLVCGRDTDQRDPALPAGGVQQGCAVIDAGTLARMSCESHEQVRVEYTDGTREDVASRAAPATSFWHFRFVTPEGKGLASVTSHSSCGGSAADVPARSLSHVPSKAAESTEELPGPILGNADEPARKPDLEGAAPVDEENAAAKEEKAAAEEETEDQKPKPDSSPTAPDHIIFVTSQPFTGKMYTRWAAAKLCSEAAKAGNLEGKFWPLLSRPGDSANDYFKNNPRPVRNTRDEIVAEPNQIWSGKLLTAVKYDERRSSVTGRVWTGSDSKGNYEFLSALGKVSGTCMDWLSEDNGDVGSVGDPTANDGDWLDSGSALTCNNKAHIYCISE